MRIIVYGAEVHAEGVSKCFYVMIVIGVNSKRFDRHTVLR